MSRSSAPTSATATAAEVPVEAPLGAWEWMRHAQRYVLGAPSSGHGRLEQGMPVPSRVAGVNGKTLAIVLGE